MIARFLIASVATVSLLVAACANGDQSGGRIERTDSSGAFAGTGPETGLVERFIGLEYSGRPPAEQFGGVNDFSRPMDPNDPTGYGIARMLFEDTHVYLLQRFAESTSEGEPCMSPSMALRWC